MTMRMFWSLLKTTAAEWWNDNTFKSAASLAFYTIFSLAPVLLIAVYIAELMFSNAPDAIASQFEALIGEEGGQVVRQVIEGFAKAREQGALAAALGLVTLLVGATAVFVDLQASLNDLWDIRAKSERGWWKAVLRVRLRSLALAVSVGFLLLVSLVISAVVSAVQAYIGERFGAVGVVWQIANLAGSFVVVTLLFAMVYKYLPDVWITWRDVGIGAAVTAGLFALGKLIIGLYLGQAAPGSAYGAAGSFAVLLVWVYYSALISFFGAEFTQVFARRHGSGIRPKPHAERVGRKADRV
jgi:membrane protein